MRRLYLLGVLLIPLVTMGCADDSPPPTYVSNGPDNTIPIDEQGNQIQPAQPAAPNQ